MSSNKNNKKNIKEAEKQELRRLYMELRRIHDAKWRNANWIELEKPLFIGYIKTFALRDDVTRRKDAKDFKDILKLINTSVTCKDKTFTKKDWKTKKKVPIVHVLKKLTKKEYNKLPDKIKRNFNYWYSEKKKAWVYEYMYPYYFVPVVNKHYAYKVREHLPELDKQEAEIENYIQTNNLWPKLNKIFGWSRYCGWDRTDYDMHQRKKKREILREVLGSLDNRVYRVKI
jgi:hypothetical protein